VRHPARMPVWPFWADVTAVAWELQVSVVTPRLHLQSFLDDRMIFGDEFDEIESAWDATQCTNFNIAERKWWPVLAGTREGPRLAAPTKVAELIYVGIDFNMKPAQRRRAEGRCTYVLRRARLASIIAPGSGCRCDPC
jgi:hypothetical protein